MCVGSINTNIPIPNDVEKPTLFCRKIEKCFGRKLNCNKLEVIQILGKKDFFRCLYL